MTNFHVSLFCAALLSSMVAACGGSSSNGSGFNATKLSSCSSSSGTCTGTDAYNTCIENKCSSSYKMCFGDGYKSGQFGGVCASYLDCVSKAPDPCKNSCALPTGDCQTCLISKIVACTTSAGCTPPQCSFTGASGSGTGSSGRSGGTAGTSAASGTCNDLNACCAKITDANLKSACEQAYSAAKSSGDAVCSAALQSLKMFCP